MHVPVVITDLILRFVWARARAPGSSLSSFGYFRLEPYPRHALTITYFDAFMFHGTG